MPNEKWKLKNAKWKMNGASLARRRFLRPIARVFQRVDLLQRIFPSLVHPGTSLRRIFPRRFAHEISLPKRPRAALKRADGVNRARSPMCRRIFFEEDAIVQSLRTAPLFQAV